MLPAETFGNRIKDLRVKKGLTAQQLADMMYVSRSTVSRWENGNRLPDISMLNQLARCLEVDSGELVNAIGYVEEKAPVILVVDDENIILKGNVRVLSDTVPNAQVYGFLRAQEAISFAEATPVDIAFVDVELKGESGLDLAGRLTQIRSRTNVIFITSYSQYTRDAWDVHASGYLMKPLNPDKVRKELSCLRYPVKGLF